MLLSVTQSSTTRLTEVSGATLVGAVNGSNTVFTTTQNLIPGSESVYFNGVRQIEGAGNDYLRSESGGVGTGYDTITLVDAPRSRSGPKTDDAILVEYDLA